jgi:hypothetical protein
MKIVYIILAHKLPEQLLRLISKLNTEGTFFLVHVDNKTDAETYGRMTGPLSEHANVHFMERRACNWGAFDTVEATLDGIRNVFELDIQGDYIILLTGQDYPIKSNEQIQRILREGSKQSFIEFFPLPNMQWIGENGGLDRFSYWYFIFSEQRLAFIKRNQFISRCLKFLSSRLIKILPFHRLPPRGIKLFGGSAYWCLTRDCAEYINEIVQRDRTFVNFFKYALAPDESFFQTVLLNSPFKNRIVNDNLRYILWFASRHPEILCNKHFKGFMSTDKLFARKFDMTMDADVLDMIDQATS